MREDCCSYREVVSFADPLLCTVVVVVMHSTLAVVDRNVVLVDRDLEVGNVVVVERCTKTQRNQGMPGNQMMDSHRSHLLGILHLRWGSSYCPRDLSGKEGEGDRDCADCRQLQRIGYGLVFGLGAAS